MVLNVYCVSFVRLLFCHWLKKQTKKPLAKIIWSPSHLYTETPELHFYTGKILNLRKTDINALKQHKKHCKHPQRSQSHSVKLIFAPLLENISGLTLVPNQR